MRIFKTMLVREGDNNKEKIENSKDVYAAMADMLDEPQELMKVLCMNTRNELIGVTEVSRGTVNASLVHPREIFRTAILSNATSIIMVHNHPSGDPKPSPEDKHVTKKIMQASEIMGIELLDHVIVGDGFYSFKEEGELERC